MSDFERGPKGDHGQHGDPGDTGIRGESGIQGERGRQGITGERGIAGDQGIAGVEGQRGPAYSSWLIRHVTWAYLLVLLGVLASFAFSNIRFDQAIARIDAKARLACQAGNERSRLASESLTEQRARTEMFDFTSLAIDPSQAENLKQQSLQSIETQLARLPYLNCLTGERAPPPGVP